MYLLLVLWATCGIQSDSSNDSTRATTASTLVSREWTNASGNKRVRAVLLRIEGDKLRLRRDDGKLSSTTLTALSDRDRHYVATHRDRLAKNLQESSPAVVTSKVVNAVAGGVQSLREVPRWLVPSQPAQLSTTIPAAVVYVRVSRGFLEDYVERNVRQRKPVRDYILGTSVVGESETRGKTRLELIPSFGKLRGKIAFEGTVHANTRGYHWPVTLHQTSDSKFRASKTVTMDENGLQVTDATVRAATNLRTNCISTSLPRLRGRIATRIAWRRVNSAHSQAESITSDHTADRLARDFDTRTNASLAKVQKAFKSKIPDLDPGDDLLQAEMRFRSNIDSVEMAIVRVAANGDERKLRPPRVQGDPDVAVRVHRSLLSRAIADPELRENLAPLFGNVLNARIEQVASVAMGADKDAPADTSQWSFDMHWLTLDYTDPEQ
jgi:SLA1 homology domain 1, SHD1